MVLYCAALTSDLLPTPRPKLQPVQCCQRSNFGNVSIQCGAWQLVHNPINWQCFLHSPNSNKTGGLPEKRLVKDFTVENLPAPGGLPVHSAPAEGVQGGPTDAPIPSVTYEKSAKTVPSGTVEAAASQRISDTCLPALPRRQAVVAEAGVEVEVEGEGSACGKRQWNSQTRLLYCVTFTLKVPS